METTSDDLNVPLGTGRSGKTRSRGAVLAARLVGGTAAAVLLTALVYALVFGDRRGGRPYAEAPITRPEPAPAPSLPEAAPPAGPAIRDGTGRRDVVQVEAASGVAVTRGGGGSAPGAVIVTVPDGAAGAPATDPRLVEAGRHGALPRIGPDGARPLDAYRRPPGELPGGAKPTGRIALVVGGLGISPGLTADATARLPAAVSLAFAPYGQDLPRLAARARADGHEILLQVPMEPFDFPDSDPGPQTLLAAARPAENQDHLHWAMGRFTGYVAVMNFMGGKLTADERALAPVLREVGARGLGMLDDGSSSRSRIAAVAGATPNARAELVVDAVPRADMIDRALEKLERSAAAGGLAVGTASALPITIERIERWSRGLAERGFLLVPVSAALAGGRGSAPR